MKSLKLHPWSKIYKSSLFLDGTDFPTGRIFEDITIVPLLSAYAKTAFYLNEPLIAYRTRPGSILSSLPIEKEVESLKAINELKLRHEKYIGPLRENALSTTTYFAAWQLRQIIKSLSQKAPNVAKAELLEECLNEFNKIHSRSIFYVLKTCFKEGSFSSLIQFAKRYAQAKYIIINNKFK